MGFRLITTTYTGNVYSYIDASDAEEAAGKALRIVSYIERNSLGCHAVPMSLVDLSTKEEFI